MSDQTVVKQPITGSTLTTAGVAAGGVALGPQIVQPIIEYIFQILTWIWPTIPVPNIGAQYSISNVILGFGAGLLIILNRPKETLGALQNRVEAVKADIATDQYGV